MLPTREGYADLHLHTVASDGTRTLDQLARAAKACALSTIAITDHDVMSSELTCRVQTRIGLEVIAGVEIKAEFGGVAGEILGYFVDPAAGALNALLAELARSRIERMTCMTRLCAKHIGLPVTLEDVRVVAAGTVGRPHLARVLIDRGVVTSFGEAFGQWLGKGRPCYAAIDKPGYRQVLDAIHDAGGVAALAHPCLMEVAEWGAFLDTLRGDGLDAVEVFYPYGVAHGADRGLSIAPERMRAMAEARGLLLTGGSDDHGPGSTKPSLGTIRLPIERVDALQASLPRPLS